VVLKTGLIIHNKYPYLAGSPYGLAGNDGIVEVKCPYSIRNEKISFTKLKYLNSANGQLNKTNLYYYQVQGLMEVLNRNWCDFVIFSKCDMIIERINRDKRFFDTQILMVLRDFYFKYYLPAMLTPNETYSEDERNWLRSLSSDISDASAAKKHNLDQDDLTKTESKSFQILENGLINDPNYYKKIGKTTTYYIATFKKFNVKVAQVNCVEFESRFGECNEVTNFSLI